MVAYVGEVLAEPSHPSASPDLRASAEHAPVIQKKVSLGTGQMKMVHSLGSENQL